MFAESWAPTGTPWKYVAEDISTKTITTASIGPDDFPHAEPFRMKCVLS
jgi:hypothetical protein